MLSQERIAELRSERGRLLDATKKILQAAERAGRDMTDDECRDFNATHVRVLAIDQELLENGEHPRGNMSRETQNLFTGAMAGINFPGDNSGRRGSPLDCAIAAWMRNANGVSVARDEYNAAMAGGFQPLGSTFEIDLPNCRPTLGSRLDFSPRNDLSTSIPGAGGTTVPAGFIKKLEAAMKAHSCMLNVSEIMVTTDGRPMPWPMLDDAEAEGVQIGENIESSEDDLEFRAKMFAARKFSSKIIKASYEVLRDSAVDLSGEIGKALGMRLGRILNRRATVGTGAATLMGIVNDATVGKTAASATAFAMDELLDLQYSVDPAYRETAGNNLGWMMNQNTTLLLRKLKDGQGHYLWEDNPQAGQPARFAGDPVYLNPHMPDVATATRPVLYGDYSKYKLRIVGKIRFRALSERYAEKDQTGFISFLEADGALLKPSSSEALSPVRAMQMA